MYLGKLSVLILGVIFASFNFACNNTNQSEDNSAIDGGDNGSGSEGTENEGIDSDTTNTDPDTETDTSVGSTAWDVANSVHVDDNGNIFLLGSSDYSWAGPNGEVPLHEHSRVLETEADCWWENGCEDVFLMKLSADGKYQWHTFIGVYTAADLGAGVYVDKTGNIHAMGVSRRGWDGPNGEPPLNAYSNGKNIFILKMTAQGQYLWHTFYTGETYFQTDSLTVDKDGSIYAVGNSHRDWNGPSQETSIYPFVDGLDEFDDPSENLFIVKLTTDGGYQWHTFFGGENKDFGTAIKCDSDGNVLITGASWSGWNGPDELAPLRPYTEWSDILVVKLDTNGVYQWHTFFGTENGSADVGNGLVVDADQNIFVGGHSGKEWIGYDLAPPREIIGDNFILKLNKDGAYQWHSMCAKINSMYDSLLAIDSEGALYLSGGVEENWLGPAGQTPLHDYSGGDDTWIEDYYIVKVDAEGMYQWHTFYGGYNKCDEPTSLKVGSNGNVVVVGKAETPWLGADNAAPLWEHSGLDDAAIISLGSDGSYQWHGFVGNNAFK